MTADKPEGARLKSCPFCGAAVRLHWFDSAEFIGKRWYYPRCGKCKAQFKDFRMNKNQAIEKWSTRHEPPILAWAEANPDAVKALLEATKIEITAPVTKGLLKGSSAVLTFWPEPYQPIEESKPT